MHTTIAVSDNRVDQKDIRWGDINWMATCGYNPEQPGNLDREVCPGKNGESTRYGPNNLEPGAIIEVASDEIGGDDRKYLRMYIEVTTISPHSIEGRKVDKPDKAVLRKESPGVAAAEANILENVPLQDLQDELDRRRKQDDLPV